ncbi:MAG: inorganic phosphate transporter [candidate division Zixibacteria bacterium SM23_73_2]|nr:MAG: inorganic phosphate transporter [candidate division Zixibacteria bacterium SM23_73_2]
MSDLILLIAIIIAALIYDFFNGFNDCANSIATTISTRALSPRLAIIMAWVLNFFGALSHTAVAATVGKGVIDPQHVSLTLVLSALIGASVWTGMASFSGIPVSVTHSLIGGLLGAGVVASGFKIIIFQGIKKIILAMILSPIFGFLGGLLLIVIISWFSKNSSYLKVNRRFKRWQIISAAWMAFSHGMNDAQNAMGIIAMALVSYGTLTTFKVPLWVILACATAMALGTSVGGWKVIKTMGSKVFKLQPVHGFSAETSAAVVIAGMSLFGAPISTTHVISTAIMGSGSSNRLSAVRWGIVKNIVITWIITIPAAGTVAALLYFIINLLS